MLSESRKESKTLWSCSQHYSKLISSQFLDSAIHSAGLCVWGIWWKDRIIKIQRLLSFIYADISSLSRMMLRNFQWWPQHVIVHLILPVFIATTCSEVKGQTSHIVYTRSPSDLSRWTKIVSPCNRVMDIMRYFVPSVRYFKSTKRQDSSIRVKNELLSQHN